MAFVCKSGTRFVVRSGSSGKRLSSYSNKKDADAEVRRLHKKNMPSSKSRGKSASKRLDAC